MKHYIPSMKRKKKMKKSVGNAAEKIDHLNHHLKVELEATSIGVALYGARCSAEAIRII